MKLLPASTPRVSIVSACTGAANLPFVRSGLQTMEATHLAGLFACFDPLAIAFGLLSHALRVFGLHTASSRGGA